MKLAETVTFGGSGLDRAAHLRDDSAALAAARSDPDARAILFWRSKPLLTGESCHQLARLAMDHPILHLAGPLVLFAGLLLFTLWIISGPRSASGWSRQHRVQRARARAERN